jgi:cation transport regulator ChaC
VREVMRMVGPCVLCELQFGRQHTVIDDLTEREGGFELPQLTIRLHDGSEFLATTAIYSREQNLLHGKSPGELAALAFAAQGTSGRCSDYVRNLAAQLAELSLVDESILGVVRELDQLTAHRRGDIRR